MECICRQCIPAAVALYSHAVNSLKCSGIKWLHLKLFNVIQVLPTFLISENLSAGMSEIKNAG